MRRWTNRVRKFIVPAIVGLCLSLVVILGAAPTACPHLNNQVDPLPSWNKGPTKQAIIRFVQTVTDKSSNSFIPPEQRIAVFDNDGTLWTEQPIYTQLFFAFDRVKYLARNRPKWKNEQPFKAVIDNDLAQIKKMSKKDLTQLIAVTHAGMTNAEFHKIAKDWLATAKHPRFKKRFTELVYQPMLEVIAYLQANDFKTYICSGGGVEFMRAFAERVYGIPPEQVLGSTFKLKWELTKSGPVLIRLAPLDFFNDGPDKPVLIAKTIGRRPVIAFGNSDGDLQMLQWTMAGKRKRLAVIVHHDDAKREYKYDRTSHIGRLDKALDQAKQKGWNVISMRNEWKYIYPFSRKVK